MANGSKVMWAEHQQLFSLPPSLLLLSLLPILSLPSPPPFLTLSLPFYLFLTSCFPFFLTIIITHGDSCSLYKPTINKKMEWRTKEDLWSGWWANFSRGGNSAELGGQVGAAVWRAEDRGQPGRTLAACAQKLETWVLGLGTKQRPSRLRGVKPWAECYEVRPQREVQDQNTWQCSRLRSHMDQRLKQGKTWPNV